MKGKTEVEQKNMKVQKKERERKGETYILMAQIHSAVWGEEEGREGRRRRQSGERQRGKETLRIV